LEPEGFSPHFWRPIACLLADFFREPENGGKKQKAGMKAGLPQFAVESAQ
jgi:hypothetical protein